MIGRVRHSVYAKIGRVNMCGVLRKNGKKQPARSLNVLA